MDGDGAGGWLPIGDDNNPFVAEFNGNGYRISNLAISRDQTYVGLFGAIGEGATIGNLGLVDNLADYTGSSDSKIYIGGLVGWQLGGLITASHATGVAHGGAGKFDRVGGLVGEQSSGLITASYAASAADGGDGDGDQVGGLVGRQTDGSITASYATGAADGGDGNFDQVGGLVGTQAAGLITASYATGAADGGDGASDQVGGLVGRQTDGSITASYATGAADGGDGASDRVGGLVGRQADGSITASYATGAADGGDGASDQVGGLVGFLEGGSITASYATGAADGGAGDSDNVGGLVGLQEGGSIVASYGFGEVMGKEFNGSDGSAKPSGVGTAAQLTVNTGQDWNRADSNTLGAWDFGNSEQIPALKYADYDGDDGTVFDCDHFPVNACGFRLPGQRAPSLSIDAPLLLELGGTVTLVASPLDFGSVRVVSWSWRQLEGLTVTLSGAGTSELRFTAPGTSSLLEFELTAVDSDGREHTQTISIDVTFIADSDGDGLIEIDSLLMLHNMRYNLAGTSYKTSDDPDSVGSISGCPDDTGCMGYELARDLDFDADGDGSTWSGDANLGYSLDADDRNDDYFPVADNGTGGWLPIGDEDNPFVAVFDGNGHRISNLAIRSETTSVGLFGAIGIDGGSGAAIRNLGLVDNLADYTGSVSSTLIGGLVGFQGGGSITASYATGDADGGAGDSDNVGGLVGYQFRRFDHGELRHGRRRWRGRR